MIGLGRGLALGGLALTATYMPAFAAPKAEPEALLPKAIVSCGDDACDLVVPKAERVEVCFELDAEVRSPQLEVLGGKLLPLVLREHGWCADGNPREMKSLAVAKKRRSLHVITLGDGGGGSPESSITNKWEALNDGVPAEQQLALLEQLAVISPGGALPDSTGLDLARSKMSTLMQVGGQEIKSGSTAVFGQLKGMKPIGPAGGGQEAPEGSLRLRAPSSAGEEVKAKAKEEVSHVLVELSSPRTRESHSGDFIELQPDDTSFLDVVLIGDGDGYHCSGILVAANAVLTAGHCAPTTVIGLGSRMNRQLVTVPVRETIVHPSLDAALLLLDRSLPVPLRPRRRANDTAPPTGVVRMVGFGVDHPRYPSSFGVKRRVDAMVVGWGCDAQRARTTGCVNGKELTIAGVGGRDTCMGDSGGPVLEILDETWRLVAITSRPTRGSVAACGHGGVYVRVDALDLWLTSSLEKKP